MRTPFWCQIGRGNFHHTQPKPAKPETDERNRETASIQKQGLLGLGGPAALARQRLWHHRQSKNRPSLPARNRARQAAGSAPAGCRKSAAGCRRSAAGCRRSAAAACSRQVGQGWPGKPTLANLAGIANPACRAACLACRAEGGVKRLIDGDATMDSHRDGSSKA